MKVLTISPFNWPESSDKYRGMESNVTGDPTPYTQSTSTFIDDLIMTLRKHKLQGIKLKPVELNFEIE